jgi:gliding motility-associated-like protein
VADQGYAKILTISPNGGYYTGPFLPAGLIIDSNTGAISGTPTTVTPAANYTVTGYNSAGVSASATVNIGVQLPDVSLAALTLSNGALNPAFLSGTLTYNANVGNGLTTMTVTPTANNPTAIITVQGNVVTSGQPSQALNLVVGVNTIAVVITDANHLTSKTYTLKITEAQSSNNNLASVTTSAGLAQGVTVPPTITESVMNSVTSLTVTPAVADPNAMVKVNGASVTSGQPSATIPLNVGANTITIIVTAQDTKTKTYTLTVTRAPSANDNLSNLVVSSGTLSPEFGTATNYLDYIANGVPFSITPTVGDATATVTINGSAATSGAATAVPLVVGNNTITIVVTAQNTTSTKTYTVVVNEARSPNSTLFSLITSAGFSQGQTVPATLAESVPNATGTITVTPTMANNSATVTVNGIAVTSGTASTPINLNVGTNTITIVGTAQNGNITTYTLTVTRAPSASLSNLTLSAGTLGPAFAPATTAYTTAVGNGVSSITVTPTAAGAGAIIRINGKTVASGSASSPIALAVGNTSIGITVTAVDNSSTITYNVGVNRSRSSNDALLSFKTSAGLAIGVPVPATLTESVVNATSAITVTPTAEDTTATVTVNGATVPSGTASASISLAAGSNTITTVVTAQSGVSLTYTLTVTRAIGSMNTVYQPVGVQNFEPLRMADDGINVHQGVSPNGDGINDYLQIDNITNYPDNKISIMNRNGQLVYEAKGYDNATKSFDGHSNKTGQMQLPGTYFYELDYTIDGVTKHKTGFLVLKY